MKKLIPNLRHVLIITIGLLIAISCTSCEAYVDYLNNTPVRTQYIERPYYPNAYHSFYGAGGLGYYSNFYSPVYRPYRARPLVRTRTVRPVRRVVKPRTPVRRVVKPRTPVRRTTTRPVRRTTTKNVVKRTNVGRKGQKQ